MCHKYDAVYKDKNVTQAIELLEKSGYQLNFKGWMPGFDSEFILFIKKLKRLIFSRKKPEPNAIVDWEAFEATLKCFTDCAVAVHLSSLVRRL